MFYGRDTLKFVCTILRIILGLASLSPALSNAGSFHFNPKPLPLTHEDMIQWRRDFQAPIFKFATDPDSDLGKKLQENGDLTLEERAELMDFMECRPLLGVPVVVCMSFNESTMNDAFVRLSIFKDGGGGAAAGKIVARNFQFLYAALELAAGHNTNIQTARDFFAKAKRENTSLSKNETSLRDKIMPALEALGEDNLQILSISYKAKTLSYFSHEVNHAILSARPEYRATVTEFWDTVVSESDREAIRNVLSNIGYDKNNERVVIDEFQAYLLMIEAETSYLKDFLTKYRVDLFKTLYLRGLHPALISAKDVGCGAMLE